ncbi:MAG: DNA-3-methyladenine glycosylase family protein [Patescibacteria group bacterium]
MEPIKLKTKTELEVIPTSPFHFDSTFYKPAHFPTKDMRYEPGKRWQTMLWNEEKLGLIFENSGTRENPRVTVYIFSKEKLSPEFLKSLKKEIIWRFNLDLDLSGFYQDVSQDPLLKPIIKRFYGLRPMHAGSLYEYLIIDIVLQNAQVKRSVYMMQTLFENYGSLLEFDNQKFWAFWEPRVLVQTSEQKLRDLKMGYRAKSLIKVSEPFSSGEIDELKLRNASQEEQEKTLLSLYGIGPASVGYIMFDVFHRFDFLKHISPWEQKIYNKIFFNKDWEKELVPVREMLRYFQKWGKWKNLAVHYVWEDIWWRRRKKHLPWLERLIRL